MFVRGVSRSFYHYSINTLYRSVLAQKLQLTTRMDAARTYGTGLGWRPPPPCRVGDKAGDIDTPALIIDLDKMENNLRLLPKLMTSFPGVDIRPHAKAHKCPELAKLQIQNGAVGMCCQTLVETEAMVYGGECEDVLLSNQLIGKPKLRRLAALAKQAKISICVDSSGNVRDISDVARELDVTIQCVVEVNVGQDRCGVQPGNAAVVLAKEIIDLPNVMFLGIQCYQGLNQHIREAKDRAAAVGSVVDLTKATLKCFDEAGVSCAYVTGAGTGTFLDEAASGVFTEIQPGSYVLMDADYGRNRDSAGNFFRDFQQSLFVLSTVQSITPGDRAVVDAGMKALSLDSGDPLVTETPEIVYYCGGDEHGILKPGGDLKVGDLVWLTPGHCDPTVNMYDWLVGVRRGVVETVWSVLGRGPGV